MNNNDGYRLLKGGPPDSAMRVLESAARRIMNGDSGYSTFTAVALVGAYQVGASEEDARHVARGIVLRHPDFGDEVTKHVVARLRHIADEIERASRRERGRAS